ncbi:MAG: NifB/NifX family molybdenum-iron cluster-binding protein [Planctomycetota bacterium]
MKIAVSSQGPHLSSGVDARFGRAPWFIVIDADTGAFETVRNEQNVQAAQGAGIQSAQLVVNHGAQAVLTGHCGPKAFRVLKAAGVRVYLGLDATVADALEKFKAGSLDESSQADVEGHWV